MLDIMRKYAGSWFIKVILIGVALSFVGGFLLLPSVKRHQGMENTAAEVNGHPIYRQEWEETYHRMLRTYREMFKDQMDENMLAQFNLKERALQGIIEKRLKMEAAERLDVQVSDHEVQQSILAFEAFQRDGRFNIDLYRRLLRANRISEDEFIAGQRETILLEKLDSLISHSCKVSDKEVRDEFMIKNEKVNLSYVEIRTNSFVDEVEVEDEQVADYYESNKSDFLTDPKVKVEYLKLSPKGFEADIRLDNDEVFDYYDVNMETYSDPEKIKARHILIKANRRDPKETRDEARKRLDDLLARVKEGEDFTMLARQNSEDQKTAAAGGDLGFFERGKMVKAFEDAAFSLKPGEVSDVVESPFGFHIIKVDGYLEAKTKPFEEVKSEIRDKLVNERATRRARRKADSLQALATETRDLASFAEGEMIVFDTTDFFAADETVPGIGRNPNFFMTADSLIQGDISDVIEVGKDYYILKQIERQEPRIPELDEIRDEVTAAFKASRSRELARTKAGEIQEKLAGGASLQALADEYHLKVMETGVFSRERDLIPRIGPSADLKKAAFELTAEKPVPADLFEIREKLVLVELKEHTGMDEAAFKRESANLKERLLGNKRMEMTERWMESLRADAKISINPTMEIQ